MNSLVTSVVSAGVGLLATFFLIRASFPNQVQLRRTRFKTAQPRDKIDELRETLKRSGDRIKEVQAEFKLQEAALDRIKSETEENQRLAELNKTEADAVRLVIATAQAQATKPSRRQQWLFFLAGLFFSVPLGIGVNFLYDIIAH